MMPISVLRTWFLGLLGWAVLAVGIYLIWRGIDGLQEDPTSRVAVQRDDVRATDVDVADRAEESIQQPDRVGSAESDHTDDWAALLGGVALILLSTVGPYPIIRLLAQRPSNEPDPKRKGRPLSISRPDGSRIHGEVFGPEDATTLICTHGWSLDRTDWRYVVDRLSDRYRVVAWDLPGLGKSKGADNRDCSLEKYAKDLYAVIGAVGDRPTILVGHSIGGMIIQTLCRLHPEIGQTQVRGIALVHTTYRNPLTTMLAAPLVTALQKPLIEPLNHVTIALAPLAWLSNWQSYLNGSLHLTTRLSSFAGRQSFYQIDEASFRAAKAWPGVLARGNLSMLRFDAEATLPSVTVPALVVAGKQDRITKREASERIDALLPHSDLVVLDPGGHLGLWESNDQFLAALDRFVVQVAGSDKPSRPTGDTPHPANGVPDAVDRQRAVRTFE